MLEKEQDFVDHCPAILTPSLRRVILDHETVRETVRSTFVGGPSPPYLTIDQVLRTLVESKSDGDGPRPSASSTPIGNGQSVKF